MVRTGGKVITIWKMRKYNAEFYNVFLTRNVSINCLVAQHSKSNKKKNLNGQYEMQRNLL